MKVHEEHNRVITNRGHDLETDGDKEIRLRFDSHILLRKPHKPAPDTLIHIQEGRELVLLLLIAEGRSVPEAGELIGCCRMTAHYVRTRMRDRSERAEQVERSMSLSL